MPDYLPLIQTIEDARQFANQVIGRGVPLVDGGGIVFDTTVQAHTLDFAQLNTTYATVGFATLIQASLTALNNELSSALFTIIGGARTATGTFYSGAAVTSTRWLCERIQNISTTQGGTSWNIGTSIWGGVVYGTRTIEADDPLVGGTQPLSQTQVATYLSSAGFSTAQLNALSTMLAVLGNLVGSVRQLVSDLKSKNVLQ